MVEIRNTQKRDSKFLLSRQDKAPCHLPLVEIRNTQKRDSKPLLFFCSLRSLAVSRVEIRNTQKRDSKSGYHVVDSSIPWIAMPLR